VEPAILRGEKEVRENGNRRAALDDSLHRDELGEEIVALEADFHDAGLSGFYLEPEK
jgi:hypothetical protein